MAPQTASSSTVPGHGVAGLILAGGRGARMGEADKGLLMLHGEPLVAHVARRLAPQVQALLVSANRNAPHYAGFGTVLADDSSHGAYAGPLAGVLSGLAAWSGTWLVAVPCDTPFLPEDLAARLIAAAEAAGVPLAVARAGGRRHSVCMAAQPLLHEDLRAYLAQGGRKVEAWQQRVGAVEVEFGEDEAFMNLNTPAELAQAEARAARADYASQYRKS